MASQGPNSPASAVTEDIGRVDWANPSNALSSNDSYATVVLSNQGSDQLIGQNFGFAIPSGATINGIKMEAEGKDTAGNGDMRASLRKPDNTEYVIAGAGSVQTFTTTEQYHVWGTPTELWQTTWTPADINSVDFESMLRTDLTTETNTISVDHIRITVYYTEGAGQASRTMHIVRMRRR